MIRQRLCWSQIAAVESEGVSSSAVSRNAEWTQWREGKGRETWPIIHCRVTVAGSNHPTIGRQAR
jgi:hypothetical protein